jgi:allantoicase
VESDLIDRAEVLPVLSVQMPVLTATDIVVTKLMALDEHYCDFARLLPVARALREQVDWAAVRREVEGNDFAVVFLELLDRLGVVEAITAA